LPNWKTFAAVKVLNEGLNFSLSFRIKGTLCADSTSFEFVSVCSSAYLP
jgi:hypothetical protein